RARCMYTASAYHRHLHSFPTRRSSDLHYAQSKGSRVRILFPMITTLEELRRLRAILRRASRQLAEQKKPYADVPMGMMLEVPAADRKSTRLNSSHVKISYAVFCLKQKD